MKFKILKGTETYAKLAALWKRMQAAFSAAKELAKELGADEWTPLRAASGGIMAVKFKEPREGWKKFDSRHPVLYEPKQNNKELRDRIRALPVVHYKEINDVVGFKEVDRIDETTGLWHRTRCPGLARVKGAFILDTGNAAKYTPPNADIIEILESEYQALKRKAEKA